MTNYGIQTQLKYKLPYYFGFKANHDLSKKALERLKWMDYIDLGNNVA